MFTMPSSCFLVADGVVIDGTGHRDGRIIVVSILGADLLKDDGHFLLIDQVLRCAM